MKILKIKTTSKVDGIDRSTPEFAEYYKFLLNSGKRFGGDQIKVNIAYEFDGDQSPFATISCNTGSSGKSLKEIGALKNALNDAIKYAETSEKKARQLFDKIPK